MTNPFQQYGQIAKSTSLTVLDTNITPYSLFNISKDGEIIVTNSDEQMKTSKYSTEVRNGSIQFAILNTYVTDEATYTYSSSLGDAVNYTLRVEGRKNRPVHIQPKSQIKEKKCTEMIFAFSYSTTCLG